jgi:hypothetical protein
MRKRARPNHRLVKIHYSYSVEDVAALFRVHKNTVREWLRKGLHAIDRKRPTLILGSALADFLRSRRAKSKRLCGPGQLYCVKCRAPRTPLGGLVDFVAIREPLGNLTAICPCCDSLMHRRANRTKLGAFEALLAVASTVADLHIGKSSQPCVNHDIATSEQP